jgi:hypothetical protein
MATRGRRLWSSSRRRCSSTWRLRRSAWRLRTRAPRWRLRCATWGRIWRARTIGATAGRASCASARDRLARRRTLVDASLLLLVRACSPYVRAGLRLPGAWEDPGLSAGLLGHAFLLHRDGVWRRRIPHVPGLPLDPLRRNRLASLRKAILIASSDA